MTSFLIAFISLSCLLGIFAYVAMPIASRARRAVVVSFLGVLLGALFFGYSDMLGRPKSTRLEILHQSQEAQVLGSYVAEGKAVYVWLKLPDVAEPRYYAFAWDKKLAQALQDATEENTRQHGAGVAMKLPFERGWDVEEPKVYPLPQPKLPDKANEPPPSRLYQAPEQRSGSTNGDI
jgi:hypothetical protein